MKDWQRVNELRELIEECLVCIGHLKMMIQSIADVEELDITRLLCSEALLEIASFDKEFSQRFNLEIMVPGLDYETPPKTTDQ